MFSFKVKEYNANSFNEVHGFVPGRNFSDALSKLIEYFGEESIDTVELSYVTDDELLIVPEGLVEVIKEENDV